MHDAGLKEQSSSRKTQTVLHGVRARLGRQTVDGNDPLPPKLFLRIPQTISLPLLCPTRIKQYVFDVCKVQKIFNF